MTRRPPHPLELREREVELPAFFGYLGMSVVSISPEEVVMRMDVPPALFSPFGMVHGGAIAVLIDTALGAVVATNISAYDRTATHELNINYVTFTRGSVVFAKARILRLGRAVATVECEAVSESGELIAKALGTFGVFRDKDRPAS